MPTLLYQVVAEPVAIVEESALTGFLPRLPEPKPRRALTLQRQEQFRPVSTAAESVTAERFPPTPLPKPRRALTLQRPELFAPVALTAEPTTSDRWMPEPQPKRPRALTLQRIDHFESLEPIAPVPVPDFAAPGLERLPPARPRHAWQPSLAQPVGFYPFGFYAPTVADEIELAAEPVLWIGLAEETIAVTLTVADLTMPPEQTLRLIRAQDLVIRGRFARPYDLTGQTLVFTVRDKLGGSSAIAKTTSGGGITIADAGRGWIEIDLAKGDTSGLTPSVDLSDGYGYVWDVKRTDSGANLVLARGELILEREVTA